MACQPVDRRKSRTVFPLVLSGPDESQFEQTRKKSWRRTPQSTPISRRKRETRDGTSRSSGFATFGTTLPFLAKWGQSPFPCACWRRNCSHADRWKDSGAPKPVSAPRHPSIAREEPLPRDYQLPVPRMDVRPSRGVRRRPGGGAGFTNRRQGTGARISAAREMVSSGCTWDPAGPAARRGPLCRVIEDERDWTTFTFSNEWNCNWRESLDNPLDSSHAQYIHRRALYWLGRPIPGWVNLGVIPLPDQRTLKVFTKQQESNPSIPASADTRGAFGGERSATPITLRRLLPRRVRPALPSRYGCLVSCAFRNSWTAARCGSVGSSRSMRHGRAIFLYMRRGRGFDGTFFHLRNWFLWSWAIRLGFSKQDEWIVEAQIPGSPERLSGNDAAIIAWRRWAPKWAAERANLAASANAQPLTSTTVGSET